MQTAQQPNELSACPRCSACGKAYGLCLDTVIEIDCDQCRGSGYIPVKMLEWIDNGSRLREYRVNAKNLSLREAAMQLDMPPSLLSSLERGLVDNLSYLPNYKCPDKKT